MKGRKPKPTHLKLVTGNPGKRKLSKVEPQPRKGRPDAPEWLVPEARAEWDRVIDELVGSIGLSLIDRAVLATYCQLWGRFVEGEKINKPVKATHITQMRGLAAELGLTPSSRSRISAPNPKDDRDDGWGNLDA